MEEFRSTARGVIQGVGDVSGKIEKHLVDLEIDFKQRLDKLDESFSLFLSKNSEENKTAIQNISSTSEKVINNGVLKFNTVADKVETSNNENIVEIAKLLEHYKSVVETGNSLISTLKAIDFPSKLDALSSKTLLIIESITNTKQALELKSNENLTSINAKTTTAKEIIINNTDSKFQSLSEQLINTKENLNKTISDKFYEQEKISNASFENLSTSIKEISVQINDRQDKQEKEIKLIKIIAFVIAIISVLGTIVTVLILKKP